jgi:hypothetical protein
MEQLDTEVVETVAGVARLLRRAAELVWTQADAAGPGHRINYSRWGLILQRTRHQACCLAAPGWMGPHHLGTTQLIFWRRLSSCCAGSVWWVHHRGCSV